MRTRFLLTAAIGVIGVAAGAFGAHALKESLTASGMLSTWNTAVLYNLMHAPALLSVSLYAGSIPGDTAWLKRAFFCWAAGVVLFSGSLYALSLGGPRWLGPVTPLGGLFLIAGWFCLVGHAGKAGRK